MRQPLTIATIQFAPEFGAVAANVADGLARAAAAADAGARLLVLPELSNTGYVFETRAEALALAEAADGPTVTAWAAFARKTGTHLVAGFTEIDGDSLYNSAAVVGPDGLLGVYRKTHLWAEEAVVFEPGDRGFPVWRTPIGRLGALVCYDGWFPEAWRILALKGAEIVAVPTNWVPMPNSEHQPMAMANVLVMGAAHANSLVIAAADRVGVERGQPFIGRSLIVGPDGWIVAGPASATEPATLVAEVDVAAARRARSFNPFNQVLRDRRTDLYGEMLGAADRPSWY
jgi:predicted amidohydrolase